MKQDAKTYSGGCHCGTVRFQLKVKEYQATDCNCSICQKKGFLHLIVSSEQFTLLSGENSLTYYTFNTHTAKHTFCSICGIHSFYTPRSHPNHIDVNLRCLDGNVIDEFEIESFDGQNWEANITQLINKDPL